ncbi:MAG TPA: SRPBCC family protein [Candidatus Saccharimonadia bacterium]|jgi:hypothetical protein
MAYTTKVSMRFQRSVHDVYEALCDLSSYSSWSPGLHVSGAGRMHEGLTYDTTNRFAGKQVTSTVRVLEMIPDQEISIRSDTKVMIFWAKTVFTQTSQSECLVEVAIKLEHSKAMTSLAHPVVEAITEQNILESLEALKHKLQPR